MILRAFKKELMDWLELKYAHAVRSLVDSTTHDAAAHYKRGYLAAVMELQRHVPAAYEAVCKKLGEDPDASS